MRSTNKHVVALAAAGALMLGATSISSAAPARSDTAAKAAGFAGTTHVRYRSHRPIRAQAARPQAWNPLALPFAAAAGAGTVAGALVGNTTAAVTGYPYYGYGSYPYDGYRSYASAPGYPYNTYGDAYGSYAYAPGAYGGVGLGRDIGHSTYNGIGSTAPASQDNCAVDAGYGRRDYAIGC